MEPLDARKRKLLTAVIETYIQTDEPVGSKALAEMQGNEVSSATIRSELAALGALGYLEQPHTSAGRVPTAKAYRLYIDCLMTPHAPGAQSKEAIRRRLSEAAGDPRHLLSAACEILSGMTGCAALTASSGAGETLLRRVELWRLSPHAVMAAVVTSSGDLRSRLCRVEETVTDERIAALGAEMNREFGEKPLSLVTRAAVQTLLGSLEDGLSLAGVGMTVGELCCEDGGEVQLSGEWQLLRSPDYPYEHARDLLGFLSRRERLAGWLPGGSREVQVMLGGEGIWPELSGSSVIVARYLPEDTRKGGAIGLIGPLRMDYSRAIPQLLYTARTVGSLMADLW